MEAWLRKDTGNMTLREKIGQLIFTGFPDAAPGKEFIRLVREYKIGNVILFAYNIKNAPQAQQLCRELQGLIKTETGIPAFIAADQEGGMVVRMSRDCTNMPGAMAIAATGNPENAYVTGKITARELRALGININLAPAVDVNSNPANPVIGVRSFGDSPEMVSTFAVQMMKGLAAGGVLPVLKHFPGHGDTAVDSHLALPRVDKTLEQLEKCELIPFADAIRLGAEAVMTSHILFPELEREKVPATMSKSIVTGLLRERMGFNGLVMSDCLEMNAVKEYYGTAEGALAAIKAGVDMVFVSHNPQLAAETVERIEAAVNSGELQAERLEEAVARVMRNKEVYVKEESEESEIGVVGCPRHRAEAERVSGASIAGVRDPRKQIPLQGKKFLFVGCPASHITNVMSPIDKDFNFPEFVAEQLGGEALLIGTRPETEDMERVLTAAEDKDAIVFGTYNGHLFKGQLEILNRLCRQHDNVIAVALRNPYDLGMIDENVAALAAYEYTPLSLNTLVKVLKGEILPSGRVCVKLGNMGIF